MTTAPLTECSDELQGEDCQHRMFPRCPNCHREMYAMAVWGFSHGALTCMCGHTVTPERFVRS